jgi:hypothetical protein
MPLLSSLLALSLWSLAMQENEMEIFFLLSLKKCHLPSHCLILKVPWRHGQHQQAADAASKQLITEDVSFERYMMVTLLYVL